MKRLTLMTWVIIGFLGLRSLLGLGRLVAPDDDKAKSKVSPSPARLLRRPRHGNTTTRPQTQSLQDTICFVGQSSGLYMNHRPQKPVDDQAKAIFKQRLEVLRDVSLYSWNLALLQEPSDNRTQYLRPWVQVPVKERDWKTNFDSREDFLSFMGHHNDAFPNIQVSYDATDSKAMRRSLYMNDAAMGAGNTSTACQWVVITRLDGDDAITPGYWNHVADLIHNRTFDAAGAGVVGTKHIPVIETTPDKCRANIEGNKKMVKSQGISMIYRWDVFKTLGYPYKIGQHGAALGNLRRSYHHKVQGLARVDAVKEPNYEYDHLINSTGIRYIDTMLEGWGPPALWIRTSLSSHFPWISWKEVNKGCTVAQWNEGIQALSKQRFPIWFLKHLHEKRNVGHLSLLEACQSNSYFLRFQYVRMRLKDKKQADTCDQFVEWYGQHVEEPSTANESSS